MKLFKCDINENSCGGDLRCVWVACIQWTGDYLPGLAWLSDIPQMADLKCVLTILAGHVEDPRTCPMFSESLCNKDVMLI